MEEKHEKRSEASFDPQTASEIEEKEPFVPSPKWKRIFAWVLFVIVIFGIVSWLLNIAYPGWIQLVKNWAGSLIGR